MWMKLLAVGAVVSLAACGPANGPQVATAQGPGSSSSPAGPTSSAPATDSDYDKALRYVRCMNDNGDHLPDPVEGQPLPMGTLGGGFQGVTPAYLTCKKYLPATWPVKLDPKEITRSAKFNECMRQKGFPPQEPDANGMITEPGDPTSVVQPPGYDDAVNSCRYLVDDAANGQQ